jgi:transcriptional regulator
MHIPGPFRQEDIAAMHALMRASPLATLVTLGPSGLAANHIPLLVDPHGPHGPHGTLRGHVARANPVWREFDAAQGALAVFTGPDAYITPSWYSAKAETGKVVPTWNYAVVHAAGPLVVHDDPAWVLGLVTALTQTHEAGRVAPWQVSDAPADYVERMVAAVVGIEIPIRRLEGKWKMSQNRPDADRAGVARGLRSEGGADAATMAAWILPDRGV